MKWGCLLLLPFLLQAQITEVSVRTFRLSEIAVRHFSSGLKVAFVKRNLPYTVMKIYLNAGSSLDPEGKEGLSSVTARMLMRGTKKRSYQEIIEQLEYLGSSLAVESTPDSIIISASALTENLPFLLKIVSEILLQPSFPKKEFKKVKEQALAELASLQQDPVQLANFYYTREIYREHPYNHLPLGIPSGLERISLEDVKDFYQKYVNLKGAVIIFVGGFSRKEVEGELEELFPLLYGQDSSFNLSRPDAFKENLVVIYDRPSFVQSQIRMGNISVGMDEFMPAEFTFVNTVFGGAFTSRLMKEIRVKRGLTYGISSSFNPYRFGGDFMVNTFTENNRVGELVQVFLAQVKKIREEGIRENEVVKTRNYLSGLYPITLESSSALASRIGSLLFYGKGLGSLEEFTCRIRRFTKQQADELIRRFIPEKYLIVILGPASQIKDQLKTLKEISSIEVKNGGN